MPHSHEEATSLPSIPAQNRPSLPKSLPWGVLAGVPGVDPDDGRLQAVDDPRVGPLDLLLLFQVGCNDVGVPGLKSSHSGGKLIERIGPVLGVVIAEDLLVKRWPDRTAAPRIVV